jgi:SAM-dependent methyltransferase
VDYPCGHPSRFALRFETIVACLQCGLGMALPQPTQSELDAFYAAGTYWSDAVSRTRAQSLHERNQCRHRTVRALRALGRTSGLRALDVGAGHGWTAEWLDRLAPGAAFDFIEPDETCSREILSRRPGGNTRRIGALGEARGGYDLVFLNHVLEHVADPVECITRVRAQLAPAGLAYFEVPHADQHFKADVFPHTWFFTPLALEHLAARSGMVEILRETFGRMPPAGGRGLLWRAAFRAGAALGWSRFAGWMDDRIWSYAGAPQGVWLRWIVRAPAAALRPA